MDEKENLNTCDCGCCGEEHEHEHHHDCDCGCDCGEHEPMIVELEDENGNSVSCEIVDGFAYEEKEFVLVQNPQNDSVYLFKVQGEEGELVIPDDNEFEAASKYYESIASK